MSNEGMSIAIGNIFGDMMPQKTKNKRVRVKDARKILREQEAQNLLDMDQVTDEALENAEQNGIIFIDEIDKIASVPVIILVPMCPERAYRERHPAYRRGAV